MKSSPRTGEVSSTHRSSYTVFHWVEVITDEFRIAFFFFFVMKMRLSEISCPVQRSVLRDAVLFADLHSLICRLLCSCLETEKVRKRVEVASHLWEENRRSSFSFGCSSIDLLDSFGLVKVGHIC